MAQEIILIAEDRDHREFLCKFFNEMGCGVNPVRVHELGGEITSSRYAFIHNYRLGHVERVVEEVRKFANKVILLTAAPVNYEELFDDTIMLPGTFDDFYRVSSEL